ncbi:MAG: hypothetical protein M0Q53_00285 [Prolixibacteraceae bacterium]|jgi:hypothetical protein|nr:hypothetical protein [Prolixibacteraceae bacterium]
MMLTTLATMSGIAQERQNNSSVKGFVEGMATILGSDVNPQWGYLGEVKNRIDWEWNPHRKLSFKLGLRNNWSFGGIMSDYYPYLTDLQSRDDGLMDLTFSVAKSTGYHLYANFDRALMNYSSGKCEFTLGRQRINWGINMVWTPNDLFNSFNYLDFDYAERPGSDAVRFQYYTGPASSFDVAAKLDHKKQLTAAALYRFNRWDWDFQLLSGVMLKDLVVGGGWSGQINGAGFNGEGSYFRSYENFADSTGQIVFTMALNYTFGFELFFQAGGLFNSKGITGPAGWGNLFIRELDISAKNFTKARYAVFGQMGYPITPLLKGECSVMYNPTDFSAVLAPSLELSATQALDLLLTAQFFSGGKGTEYGDYGIYWFLRLKYSF